VSVERIIEPVESVGPGAPSRRRVRAALLGYGRVGQAVAALAERRAVDLHAAGIELQIAHALVRDAGKPRQGPRLPLTTTTDRLFDEVDVVLEMLGGIEPARSLVAAALERGVAVVTANKSLLAACGPELRALARHCRVPLACEAAVVAGVPFVGALARRPLLARACRLDGILNGTSHFILSEMARGATFAHALRTAIQHGFAEPDSAADVDGRDAAEKLAILLQICGWEPLAVGALPRLGIDTIEAADIRGASRLGGAIKPIALAHLDGPAAGTAWVGPAFVPADHPLARLDGVDNALAITGQAGERVTFAGPGAGPAITAATMLDDAIEAVSGQRGEPLPAEATPRAMPVTVHAPEGGWFLRLGAEAQIDGPAATEWLAWRRLAALHVVHADSRVYALTIRATWPTVRDAIDAGRARGWAPLAVPALD
jgi:homoserine dehydrogenase